MNLGLKISLHGAERWLLVKCLQKYAHTNTLHAKERKRRKKENVLTIGRVLAEHAPSAVFSLWQCVLVIPVFRRHRHRIRSVRSFSAT